MGTRPNAAQAPRDCGNVSAALLLNLGMTKAHMTAGILGMVLQPMHTTVRDGIDA